MTSIRGVGVSGGLGRGTLVRWSEAMQDGLVDTVVLVPDLDARVAELYEARAVLSLNGGITSHGAVLARELELPCVVVSADTTCLDAMVGLEIEVDGWEGTISLPGVDRE